METLGDRFCVDPSLMQCAIKKKKKKLTFILASYRAGPRGQPIRPPQSQHPLPQQVADRRSVNLSAKDATIRFSSQSLKSPKLSAFLLPHFSAREKKKQLLESRK